MKGEKVAVAMSGGVDSSVTAAILQEKGYEVLGLTMRLWKDPQYTGGAGAVDHLSGDLMDAREVAQSLGITHHTVDIVEKFRREVVDNFVAEYGRGRTPNPCVVCNKRIKFGELLRKSLSLGAHALATGHYVRTGWDPDRGRYYLKKGIDRDKDQSYMLYTLSQEQLSRTLFPLGVLPKSYVRQKAARLGLPVAQKSESQEVCFIPGNDYRRFLRQQAGDFPSGPIINTTGKIVGRHKGLPFYTVGQRRGLGISSPEPLYVVEIRYTDNTLVVGNRKETFARSLIAAGLNFIALDKVEKPLEITARIRYQADDVPGCLYPPDKLGRARLEFGEAQQAVTPGQSVVFYLNDEEVLGGGVIERSE